MKLEALARQQIDASLAAAGLGTTKQVGAFRSQRTVSSSEGDQWWDEEEQRWRERVSVSCLLKAVQ
jgi:hypothetical protein